MLSATEKTMFDRASVLRLRDTPRGCPMSWQDAVKSCFQIPGPLHCKVTGKAQHAGHSMQTQHTQHCSIISIVQHCCHIERERFITASYCCCQKLLTNSKPTALQADWQSTACKSQQHLHAVLCQSQLANKHKQHCSSIV